MEGFRLQSYQAGGPVHEEGSSMEEESMEGDRSRFAPRQRRTPSYEYESERACGPGCGEKPWVRRGSKWLLLGSCVALVALVLFALISSLASRSGDTPSVHIPTWARWEVVCLGTGGGLDQSDLPGGFLLRPLRPTSSASGDAGTTLFGLQRALASNPSLSVPSPSAGPELTTAGALYRNSVRTYLISHGHLDHITGLIVGSPDDAYATPRKVVAGTNFTIDTLQSHVFNWKVWPNMGSAGNAPTGLYNLLTLPVGEEWNLTAGPSLFVRPFLLSHGKMGDGSTYFSTAFLLRAEDDYLLYFGDTGADQVEGNDYMKQVWTNVAPIVRAGKLKAIFLECSYGEERSDDKLYGHLNPQRFMQEIGVLAQLAGGGLEGLKVVVIHIKADDLIYHKQESAYDAIRRQLVARNTYGVDLVFPRQGDWLYY